MSASSEARDHLDEQSRHRFQKVLDGLICEAGTGDQIQVLQFRYTRRTKRELANNPYFEQRTEGGNGLEGGFREVVEIIEIEAAEVWAALADLKR